MREPVRDGLLVAPFGREAVLSRGTYFVVIPPRSAKRAVVDEFVGWLRDEVRNDVEDDTESAGPSQRRTARLRPHGMAPRRAERRTLR